MSKPKNSVDSCGSAAKRPAVERQQHLFLVLDDWEKGYSVRKVDVDALADDDEEREPEAFDDPPLARFEAVHGLSHGFVDHGTKIVAMNPQQVSPAIPAFDTATSAVGILPWHEFRMTIVGPIFASIAGKLFMFIHGTHFLGDPPPPPSPPPPRTVYTPPVQKPWEWTALDSPLPYTAAYCYAVHPDGRTLVVSSRKWRNDAERGTFSFDTERLEWTRHGEWALPFRGQAHYVAVLDAWVGICRYKGGTGHLCSSDVMPVGPGAAAPTTLPRWSLLGEEKLFDDESPLHLGATLVPWAAAAGSASWSRRGTRATKTCGGARAWRAGCTSVLPASFSA
ncbi:hypothetical protein D1007_11437 [Hordeum vulgare]|nr:hypothetical protein D1007_11437 [Hordeum vulgare]